QQHGEFTRAQREALVVGSDVAAVALVGQHPNSPIALGDVLGRFHAAVRRGVVDDQHVDVNTFLGQDAADATFEVTAVVVAGDDDADAGAGRPGRQTCSTFR